MGQVHTEYLWESLGGARAERGRSLETSLHCMVHRAALLPQSKDGSSSCSTHAIRWRDTLPRLSDSSTPTLPS
ncbi:hypothetical protein FGO68_gene13747 [Halteria grandinella]|uniref:Uncharacterized protein n=1 Tax=Halteria grandinella TaxID=5974 RepID=A0A8J8NVU7_HALGN|nr:hypothetical protein FGO68_gene13747 [Halteria grandinella]